MLSIGKIALGQHRYYEQQVARGRDDYYSGRGEAPGEWVGSGAQALGLSGTARAEHVSALLAGLDPRDPSVRLRRAREVKIAALDLTFSAPKSLSVLAAIAPDVITAQLILAHERALRAALSYLEDTAVQVRRGLDGYEVHAGEGLIAAAYRHRMSRALDPQLHTHVLAANLTRGPDCRYTALHGAPLYRAAKTAGYLYQSHLRALISERLGLRWGPVHKGAAELADVPQAVLEEFSKRRLQMLREAQAGGIGLDTKAAAETAAIASRDRKRFGLDTHTWREEVRARAGELGLGAREVEALLRAGRERPRKERGQMQLDERKLGDALAGPHGLTERANAFDERDVLLQFAAAASQGASVAEVRAQAARFLERDDVIATARGRFTTAELVGCERRLTSAVLGRRAEGFCLLEEDQAARALARLDRPLNDEQAAVVDAVTHSGRGVEVIEALAGTGKTYTAGALAEVYRSAGYRVLGVAPTGRGARELAEQGISARTLDRLLLEAESLGGELPRRGVVIFDEAGMAPTRLSARLFEAAHRARAKVIAIGDPGQLASVQAGGWLSALSRELGSLRLSEVMRQRNTAERRALAALHDGRPSQYLRWAEHAERIETFGDRADASEQALGEWAAASKRVGLAQAVMIARDNDTRAQLNHAARERLRALGLLGEEEAYGGVSLAVGDRVICRRNDQLLQLDNGTRGTVRHNGQDRIVIETDSRLVRELPASYVAEHVEHAYALTGHGMQGATVEEAIVLASPRDLTAGWSYTALSRARERTCLLIHDEQLSYERSELAPAEIRRPEDGEMLAGVARRMLERDSEQLAIQQLTPAGRADDDELTRAGRFSDEDHQEQTAVANERPTRRDGHSQLEAMRERLEQLRAQRSGLAVHGLGKLEDAQARLIELQQARDRATDALRHRSSSQRWRLGRSPARSQMQRAHLIATAATYERALEAERTRCSKLERELGDPEQIRSERDGLDRAIEQLGAEIRELTGRLAEHELDGLGPTGGPRRASERDRHRAGTHDLGLDR
jgi:conjugative relaxase-like TrwC/TraI family protein